ncbi:hypothetical protein D3C85_1613760 [compost metagenome]
MAFHKEAYSYGLAGAGLNNFALFKSSLSFSMYLAGVQNSAGVPLQLELMIPTGTFNLLLNCFAMK